jgi:hypothetical protein
VQIQGNLTGDTNPADWSPSQTLSTLGSLTVQGRARPIAGSIPSHPDDPDFGVNYSTPGRLDWLDEPGFPNMQFGGKVVNAALTDSFTSTLTSNTGATCSVDWSVKLTVRNGKLVSFTFGQ